MKIKHLGILAVFAFSTAAFAQRLYEVRPAIGGGYDVYAPRGLEAPPERSRLQIPANLVTPSAPLDYSGLINSYQNGVRSANEAIYQRAATENMQQQTRLMQQRARIEAEQYREDLEARRQAREAESAEAKLRKELAEAKLAELKIRQVEEKARNDAAEQIRRQEAQIRFEATKAQIQKESAEAKAKQKPVTLTSEQIAEYERKASGTKH